MFVHKNRSGGIVYNLCSRGSAGFSQPFFRIVYNQFFAESVDEMLSTSGNDEFIRVVTGELHSISNHITPKPGRSGDNHCVVFIEFHFFQTTDTRIFLTDIFQWNKLIEDTVIDHQQHSRIVRVVLCAKIAFGRIVCFYIVHLGAFDNLSVLLPVRSKSYSAMEEYFQIRPYFL